MIDPEESLNDLDGRELAEDRLVHALLLARAETERCGGAERLERTLREIDRHPDRRRRRVLVSGSVAAAASVLVIFSLLLTTGRAEATGLDEVIERFERLDQTYVIDVLEDVDSPPRKRPGARRGHGGRRPPKPLPSRLDGGWLYVRGGRYLLIKDTPSGHSAVNGFDGTSYWAIHPRRGVLEDLPAARDPLPEEVSDLLFLDLRDLLHAVRANYDVRSEIDATAPHLRHLVARRRAETTGPGAVELTFDSRTGQLHELICAGLRLRRGPSRFSLRIRLVDTNPLPDNWFELEFHWP